MPAGNQGKIFNVINELKVNRRCNVRNVGVGRCRELYSAFIRNKEKILCFSNGLVTCRRHPTLGKKWSVNYSSTIFLAEAG